MALILIYEFAVLSEADLRFVAPEGPIIAVRDRGIPLRWNVHPLPAEIHASIVVDACQSGAFHT